MADFNFNINRKEDIKRRTDQAASRALTVIGMRGSEYVANLAPVDTGNLRGSIDFSLGDDYVVIGSNVKYAVFQELGTIKMKAANGGKGYLRPALKGSLREFQGIIEECLKNI